MKRQSEFFFVQKDLKLHTSNWQVQYTVFCQSIWTDMSKQCRPRSDAAERGVWSGSTLFAIQEAFF